MSICHSDITHTLAADTVFEAGFSALADSFNAGAAPGTPFSQWISIVPTSQIVATTYQPLDLMGE